MSSQEYDFDSLKPLRQKNNDQYEPTEEEIQEYADFLGVNLPEEEYMLPLIHEGISAKLPPQWQACSTQNGDLVYRNLLTKVIQEQHPLDQFYRQKVISFRTQYSNQDALPTICEEQNQEHSNQGSLQSFNQDGSQIEMPSQQLFQSTNVLKPDMSSELNRAVIQSSERFSSSQLSRTQNLLDSEKINLNEEKINLQQKEILEKNLRRQLEYILKQQQLAQDLLSELKMQNEQKVQQLKKCMRKTRK